MSSPAAQRAAKQQRPRSPKGCQRRAAPQPQGLPKKSGKDAATERRSAKKSGADQRRRIEFAAAYQSECAAGGRYGALEITKKPPLRGGLSLILMQSRIVQ